jgi:hypothetical protein
MAYGTENGVSNNLIDYADLIDASAITEEMVSECRGSADGLIDARIAAVTTAPLASPPALVNCISDDLTTYFLLRRLFTGKDPNDSQWVDKFYTRPLELLDGLVRTPQIFDAAAGGGGASGPDSTTRNQDRVFSVSRTSGGSPVSSGDDGTMDDW